MRSGTLWALLRVGSPTVPPTGDLDADDVRATLEQLKQIPLDPRRVLNAIHTPEDAGEYTEALVAIMRRIPAGWGRWIGCGKGWYPLVVEHDAALADLCADDEVHQVKEKFGTLRYYAYPCSAHTGVADQFRALELDLGRRTAHICEDCGAPGRLCVKGYWYRALCDESIEVRFATEGRRYAPAPPGTFE